MTLSPKTLFRRFASSVICSDVFWGVMPGFVRRSAYLSVQRRTRDRARVKEAVTTLTQSGDVLDGPFAGMRFVGAETRGSKHVPRLIGSYESELHPHIVNFSTRSYPVIMDIGFAEGYYLVGLGLANKTAQLVGFDCDDVAHYQCRQLAKENGVDDLRLILKGTFTHSAAAETLPCHSLVICDCEGFEQTVFDADHLALWRQSDLIIECHDFIENGVSKEIIANLEQTHSLTIVKTEGAESKLPFTQKLPELASLELPDLNELVFEGRPADQVWIVAEPFVDQ